MKMNRQFHCYLLLGSLGFSITSYANPQGGQVISGSANIVTDGLRTEIQQSSNKAIIQWDSFNIGSNEHTHFAQPDASAIALNRIKDTNPSQIYGRLTATGQVLLLNHNGILFGPNSQVDLPGLLASTLNITDQNFLNENYLFEASSTNGVITNMGNIKIHEGGYAALLGQAVNNQGVIEANLGRVALASGDRMTVDLTGNDLVHFSLRNDKVAALSEVNHSGRITANGGRVLMTSQYLDDTVKGVINMDGIVEANTVDTRDGQITFTASSINITGGTVTANASEGFAGTIRFAAENDLNIDAASVISAQGFGNATGGFIAAAGKNAYSIDSDLIISSESGDGGWLYLGDDTLVAKYIENPNLLRENELYANGTFAIRFDHFDENGQFASRGIDMKTIIGEDTTYFRMVDDEGEAWAKLSFLGTNENSYLDGEQQGSGVTNYLLGSESDWVTGVKHYKRVTRKNMYDGIDMVYYGNRQGNLEYDVVVNPGADYSQISFNYEDADSVVINERGQLVIQYGDRYVTQSAPVIYQENGNDQTIIAGHYVLGANNSVSFEVADYDASKALIIDPVVTNNFEYVLTTESSSGLNSTALTQSATFDDNNNAYLVGFTDEVLLTTTSDAVEPIAPGATDGFLLKIDENGNLVYSTYIGGTGVLESADSVTVDGSNIYVGGVTDNDVAFTATSTTTYIDEADGTSGELAGYVLELTSDGANANRVFFYDDDGDVGNVTSVDDIALTSGGDIVFTMTVDDGSQYAGAVGDCMFANVTGTCASVGATQSMFFKSLADNTTATVQHIESTDNGFTFVEVDSEDFVYLAGTLTDPTTVELRAYLNDPGIFGDGIISGDESDDAWLAILEPDGNQYDLYGGAVFGGTNAQSVYDLAVDSDDFAYIVGGTDSTDFISDASATLIANGITPYQSVYEGGVTDGTLAIFDPDADLEYLTFFGASGDDEITAVDVTDDDQVLLGGLTNSTDAIVTTADTGLVYPASQPSPGGGINDNFLAILDPADNTLVYSTYAGDSQDELGFYAVNASGSINSLDNPLTIQAIGEVTTGGGFGRPIYTVTDFTNAASAATATTVNAVNAAMASVASIDLVAGCL